MRAAWATCAWEAPRERMSGTYAAPPAINVAPAASAIATGRGFQPAAAESAKPQAAVTITAMINSKRCRISVTSSFSRRHPSPSSFASVLVHPDGVADEQVHAGGQAKHGAGQEAPGGPAVLAVEPVADQHA